MAQFVVITGPIGSGKSTVARGLADRFRAAGRSAAAVDLDDVVAMMSAPVDQVAVSWDRARRAHSALTAAWLRSGIDAVIAHGPFYTSAENDALLAEVPANVVARRVLLLVSYGVALERVAGEPTRGASKDPEFLRRTHLRFDALRPDMADCEWEFDTSRVTAAEVVSDLAAALVTGT